MTSARFRFLSFRLLNGAALVSVLLAPATSRAQDQSRAAAKTSPDNSATNQTQSKTAEQQSEATSYRMLTKKIRQALNADKSLSVYGHNKNHHQRWLRGVEGASGF
jgi:hyperosmotically inducible protein